MLFTLFVTYSNESGNVQYKIKAEKTRNRKHPDKNYTESSCIESYSIIRHPRTLEHVGKVLDGTDP